MITNGQRLSTTPSGYILAIAIDRKENGFKNIHSSGGCSATKTIRKRTPPSWIDALFRLDADAQTTELKQEV